MNNKRVMFNVAVRKEKNCKKDKNIIEIKEKPKKEKFVAIKRDDPNFSLDKTKNKKKI